MKKRLSAILLVAGLLLFSTDLSAQEWAQTNGPEGCDIRALAVDGAKVYAAVRGFGVYLTSDHGAHWAAFNAGLPAGTDVTCFKMEDETLYAGTEGGHVYLTSGAGKKWQRTSAFSPRGVVSLETIGTDLFIASAARICVCPDHIRQPDLRKQEWLFDQGVSSLARMGTELLATSRGDIFIFRNENAGWTARKMAFPEELYAEILAVSGENLIVGTLDGLLVSPDNGVHWKNVSLIADKLGISCLSVCGPLLLTCVGDDGDFFVRDFFVSETGGESWRPVSLGLRKPEVHCVCAIGTDLIAGTGIGAFLSRDGGTTWKPVNSGLPFASNIACLASNGRQLVAGGWEGLYRSPDNGGCWEEIGAGLPLNSGIRALAAVGNDLFAGTGIYSEAGIAEAPGDGVFVSTDDGLTWKRSGSGLLQDFWRTDLVAAGQQLYVSTMYDVYSSEDHGVSWKIRDRGLPGSGITCLVAIGQELFAGVADWGKERPLPEFPIVAAISLLAQKLYAMGPPRGGALFYSSDGGLKWHDTGARFSRAINGIAKIGTDLFVGTKRGLFVRHGNAATGKFREVWDINNDFAVNCLLALEDRLLVGTDEGVLIAYRHGGKWGLVHQYFPEEIPVTSFMKTKTALFAGTRGRGVWRVRLSDLE